MTCGNQNSKKKKNYFHVHLKFLKVHNGHKNEKLEKNIQEQYVCIMNMNNDVKPIITFNKAQGMMNI